MLRVSHIVKQVVEEEAESRGLHLLGSIDGLRLVELDGNLLRILLLLGFDGRSNEGSLDSQSPAIHKGRLQLLFDDVVRHRQASGKVSGTLT